VAITKHDAEINVSEIEDVLDSITTHPADNVVSIIGIQDLHTEATVTEDSHATPEVEELNQAQESNTEENKEDAPETTDNNQETIDS